MTLLSLLLKIASLHKMQRLRSAILIAAAWAMLPVALAQVEHRQAAQALHEALASEDATTTIRLVASAMGAQDPALRKHRAIVEGWLADQMTSPEYAQVKIAAYMDVYSEEELRQILVIVKNPAFRVFQAKHQQTLHLSAPKLMQLARDGQPELERMLQQAERAAK